MSNATSKYLSGSVVDSRVAIVLAEDGERRTVATVSFFAELADHPNSLWISLTPECYSQELIQASGRFTLAVLHEGQQDLAWHCALSSGRDTDKLSKIKTRRGRHGFLIPDDCLSAAACQVRTSKIVGDHVLFVADIVAGERTNRDSHRALLTRDL